MNADNPAQLVSVVIPCYNNERYLSAAIDSVLAQDHRPLEILVVDDGSTDDSGTIALQYGSPVRLLSQSNQGIASARNTGVKVTSGYFLAFLDSDDLWSPDKLAIQMKALEESPETDCAFAHAEQFHSPDLSPSEREKIYCPPGPLPARHPSAMLIHREAFMRVGLFDESLTVAEFVDWMARGTDSNLRSIVLPDILLRRRLHRSNTGITQRGARRDFARVLKAALDRRRQAAGSSSNEN